MRKLLVAGGVALVAGAVFVAVWFQPQKLVIDDTVVEPAPTTSAPSDVLATGAFRDRAHHASGAVRVIRAGDRQVLRLDGLDVENGPDLYVYLAQAKADAPNAAFGSKFVSLGKLKGNKGDQTYAIPPGTDLASYGTVAIWCKRFSVVFGTAALTT